MVVWWSLILSISRNSFETLDTKFCSFKNKGLSTLVLGGSATTLKLVARLEKTDTSALVLKFEAK